MCQNKHYHTSLCPGQLINLVSRCDSSASYKTQNRNGEAETRMEINNRNRKPHPKY